MSSPDSYGIVHATARCHEGGCDFRVDSRNAVGVAAQHAERTGHEVSADEGRSMVWNAGGDDG